MKVRWAGNYSPSSTRIGAAFKARRMGTSRIVVSDFAVLCTYGAEPKNRPGLVLNA